MLWKDDVDGKRFRDEELHSCSAYVLELCVRMGSVRGLMTKRVITYRVECTNTRKLQSKIYIVERAAVPSHQLTDRLKAGGGFDCEGRAGRGSTFTGGAPALCVVLERDTTGDC